MRAHRSLPLTVAVTAASLSTSASAADLPGDTQSLPCRPTIACTADITPPGALELETGALFRHLGTDGRQWTFPILAKLTLIDRVQLQVGSNGYDVQIDQGAARYFDNLSVGVKLHLVDQSALLPSVSLSAAASIPTWPGEGYVRADDAFFIAYVTKDIGPLHADLNLGLNEFRIEGDARRQEWIALAVSTPLPPPFGIMAEGYYFTDASPLATRDGGFLFAVSHNPKPWLVFDLGGDVGMFPSIRSFSTFIGMTVVPFLLWKRHNAPSSVP